LPHWQTRYAITIYQQGWRLGGKGASGRNQEHGDRIEEHGLHLLFGFYENAFGVLRRAWRELSGDDDAWRQHFARFEGALAMPEVAGGRTTGWKMSCPTNELDPGDGQDVATDPWLLVRNVLAWAAAQATLIVPQPPVEPELPPSGNL